MVLADAFDLYFGELLAVAVLHRISFSALLFEYRDLVALHMLQYFTGNGYTGDRWRAHLGLSFAADQQYPVEVHGVAGFTRQPGCLDILVLDHLILLAGNVYNRVHSYF